MESQSSNNSKGGQRQYWRKSGNSNSVNNSEQGEGSQNDSQEIKNNQQKTPRAPKEVRVVLKQEVQREQQSATENVQSTQVEFTTPVKNHNQRNQGASYKGENQNTPRQGYQKKKEYQSKSATSQFENKKDRQKSAPTPVTTPIFSKSEKQNRYPRKSSQNYNDGGYYEGYDRNGPQSGGKFFKPPTNPDQYKPKSRTTYPDEEEPIVSSYPPYRGKYMNSRGKTPTGTPGVERSQRQRTPRSRNSEGRRERNGPRTPSGQTPKKSTPKKSKDRFEPHLSKKEIEEGLKNKTLVKGVLRINGRKTRDSYVTVPGLTRDIFVDGPIFRNRALEGDIVIVQIFDKSQWKKVQKKGEESDEEEVEEIVEELFDDHGNKTPSVSKEAILEKMEDKNIPEDKLREVERAEIHKEAEKLASILEKTTLEDLEDESEDEEEDDDEVEIEHDDEEAPISTPMKTSKQEEAQQKLNVEAANRFISHALENPAVLQSQPPKVEAKEEEEELQPTGKIVGIYETRHSREQVGWLNPMNQEVKSDDRFAMFVPSDIKIPKIFVPTTQIPEFTKNPKHYENKLVKVEIIQWKTSNYFPLGKYKGLMGEAGEIHVETEALLVNNDVDFSDFSKDVLDCLPQSDWKIPPEEFQKRRDLRSERIFTIDPPTAKDLDDALHCKRLPDGNFEVGVHIADVSYFVRSGTKLDEEAQSRATTVYLVQKAIPMLPHFLCENLCSLNPGVDRFAFSVIWKMTPDGKILDEWFGRSIIRSCSKMTYDVAQLILEGKIKQSFSEEGVDKLFPNLGPMNNMKVVDMVDDVLNMQSIAVNLRRKRFEGGALAMNNIKLAFKFDDKSNPISTFQYVTKEANHLVEEYMLLANQQVAIRIAKFFPENALLRNHVNPLVRKLETFVKFVAQHMNLALPTESARSVGDSLDKLRSCTSPLVFQALQLLATRSMQLAKYFCTGDLPLEEWKHYALNMDRYTHFTSPIRRYPDILVHRLLEASILKEANAKNFGKEYDLIPKQIDMSILCEHCNDKKQKARKAQEQSSLLYLCVLLKESTVNVEAIALNLGDKYIAFLIPAFGVEKRVYMEDAVINHSEYKEGKVFIYWPEKPGVSDVPKEQKTPKKNDINKNDKNNDKNGKNDKNDKKDQENEKEEEKEEKPKKGLDPTIMAKSSVQTIKVLDVVVLRAGSKTSKGRFDLSAEFVHPKEASSLYCNLAGELVINTSWNSKNGNLKGVKSSILEAEESVD